MADDPTRRDVEEGARRGAEEKGGAGLARALLREQPVAALATVSLRFPGHPFASLVPFAVSEAGLPLLLLSALSEHTRNLTADPRASLLVHDAAAAGKDARAAARATLVGRARRVSAAEEPDARARYLARNPAARGLLNLDFGLWVLEVEEVHVVGGFAAAGWFGGGELRGAE